MIAIIQKVVLNGVKVVHRNFIVIRQNGIDAMLEIAPMLKSKKAERALHFPANLHNGHFQFLANLSN